MASKDSTVTRDKKTAQKADTPDVPSREYLEKVDTDFAQKKSAKQEFGAVNSISQNENGSNLAAYLRKNARHLSAFQAIELIENALDEGREVGTHVHGKDEKLFFEVDHSLRFPLSDVVEIQPIEVPDVLEHFPKSGDRFLDEKRGKTQELELLTEPAQSRTALLSDQRFRMRVTFLGLHGSNTPLPSFYAEQIARYDAQESVSKAFFDFFHNRIVGLLYRGWRKFRYYRRYRPSGEDVFSRWIYSLFGLGFEQARVSTRVYWPRLLCFAGMLSTRNRSPALISAVIAHAFELPSVGVEQWVKRKVPIPLQQKSALGRANVRLGDNFVLGDNARDIQGKIRICIGALTFKRLQDFLPHEQDFKTLRGLVEFMLRDQISYDLKLGLRAGEAYPITLAKDCPGRLGWSSFLGGTSNPRPRDVIIRVRR